MAAPKKREKQSSDYVIAARAHIGHVHLKVANIERALGFYCGVLGFEVTQRFGDSAAFLSAGGYHHHLAVNTWESLGGSPPPAGTTGLYHTAIVYPTRAALAEALRRVVGAGIALDGAADHGVSESIYLRDPDENGVELYCDRPKELWPRTSDGKLAMYTRPLDLHKLLSELKEDLTVSSGPKDL
jgi:catechol 2,3-dioxygenase